MNGIVEYDSVPIKRQGIEGDMKVRTRPRLWRRNNSGLEWDSVWEVKRIYWIRRRREKETREEKRVSKQKMDWEYEERERMNCLISGIERGDVSNRDCNSFVLIDESERERVTTRQENKHYQIKKKNIHLEYLRSIHEYNQE